MTDGTEELSGTCRRMLEDLGADRSLLARDARLVEDVGLDSLHLLELAYAVDELCADNSGADFPFFETAGEFDDYLVRWLPGNER